tara:strand:- start:1501 stop:1647 length:147 start_codon:yes stop_codon:yes gene_type:complete
MTKKERKIVEELKGISTFYNHWDVNSMRMTLWNVKQKLKELMGENNGR